MTTPAGSGPVAPLQLTPLERPAFAALFAAADPASSGIITGSSAVQFFSKSRPALDGTVLGAIWSLADRANNGFLGKAEWAVAMRLLGHAQRGTAADQLEGMLSQPGPPPSFEGVTLPGAQATPTRASSVAQVPQVSPADRARYTRIFASSGPVNGLLDGEKAKGILVRSKLPFDQLGQIWGLADTRSRGALDLTDFIIAMHFLQASMNGSLGSAGLPATLPPGLYEQAAGGAAVPPGSPSRGLTAQHTGGSIPGGIPRQLTGQGARPSGFLSPQQTGAPAAVPTLAGDWLVSPADKAKADRFFDGLDTERKGTLEGQAAVPFFMQSGLPEATLAHVWDLSDITQSGNLSRDEFAVAMHLINGALTGSQLPQELPAGLIPPSLRGRDLPAAVNPQESDTQKDLFSLMDDDEPTALPVNPASAFVKPTSSVSAVPPPPAPKGTGPFDDDFFSGPVAAAATPSALSPAVTGNNSAIRAAASPVPPVTDASAEVGNKRLALDSTNKALTGLQSKRAELEQTVSTNSTDIAELESRLTVVRATHDKESAAVKTLQERATSQAAELKTLREETIRAESDLSALRAEKDEIEQTVLRDREDVRDMKKRMAELQAENNTLRTALEKLRKEARQQKGLTAISRKQLSSAESEGDKL
ncbi:EF-hand, partial [Ceraceosorus guamensis]